MSADTLTQSILRGRLLSFDEQTDELFVIAAGITA